MALHRTRLRAAETLTSPFVRSTLDDFAAEHEELATALDSLSEEEWLHDSASEGWAVIDQVSHLAFYDERATISATDPQAFLEDAAGVADFEARHISDGRRRGGAGTLAWWREANRDLRDVMATHDPKDRMTWYGPPMSARSFITARIMETWAHGQDIVDALGLDREPTDRLRHIAHLGVVTFRWSFENRGIDLPESAKVRVELQSPSGEQWVWNGDGAELVSGPALDFCLLVTQRRHRDDVALVAEGPSANAWLDIAQCFAGPPGQGRPPMDATEN